MYKSVVFTYDHSDSDRQGVCIDSNDGDTTE